MTWHLWQKCLKMYLYWDIDSSISHFVFEGKFFLLRQNTHIEKFPALDELLPLANLNDSNIYVTLSWQKCTSYSFYTLKYGKCIPNKQHNHFQSLNFHSSRFDHFCFFYISKKKSEMLFRLLYVLTARLKKQLKGYITNI